MSKVMAATSRRPKLKLIPAGEVKTEQSTAKDLALTGFSFLEFSGSIGWRLGEVNTEKGLPRGKPGRPAIADCQPILPQRARNGWGPAKAARAGWVPGAQPSSDRLIF